MENREKFEEIKHRFNHYMFCAASGVNEIHVGKLIKITDELFEQNEELSVAYNNAQKEIARLKGEKQ